MQSLADFLPVVVFFGVYGMGYWLAPHLIPGFKAEEAIYWATAAALIYSVAQVGWMLAKRKPIGRMTWINVGLIVVMGGLTLAFHDKTFLFWKASLIDWATAGVMLLSPILGLGYPLRGMTGGQLQLPDTIWARLGHIWGLFFIGMGCLNLYIAFNFRESIWVAYKSFGSVLLVLLFAAVQGIWLAKHLQEDAKQS